MAGRALPVIQATQPVVGVGTRVRADAAALTRDTDVAADAARRAADRVFNFAEKQKAVQDTIALGEASAGAIRELDTFRVDLDKDGDHATKAERFKKHSDEVRKRYADRFGGEAQARFLASYENTSLTMENSVRHAARRDEVEQGRVSLAGANEELVSRAALARSPEERDALLKQVDDNLQEAVKTGIYTAAQHKTARRATLAKFDEAQALSLIRTNPSAALKDLGTERFQYMDPVRRELLRGQAQQRLEQLGTAARAEARVDAADLIAGFRSDIPPADAEARIKQLRAVDPKLAARVEGEARVAATLTTFRAKALPDQQQILKEFDDKAQGGGLSADERQSYQRMQQTFAVEIQRWTSDPFAAALQTSRAVKELYDRAVETVEDPTVQASAREAALEWQTKNGVPGAALAVVSKAQAKKISEELATLDGAAFNQRWQQLKQQYGSHFDHLQRQIVSAAGGVGKVASLGTVAEMPETPQGQTARANLIDSGKISEDDLKKLYPDNKELSKVRGAIETELAPLRASLGGANGGMATAVRYTDDAIRLAAFFQQQGLSSAAAVKRAVQQLVGDHYAFVPDNGGQVRVPRTVDGGMVNVGTVTANLEAAREALKPADLLVPPNPTPGVTPQASADAFARRVKAYSRWMTEQGGRGAVLVYEANGRLQPVLQKDGKPVRLDFTAGPIAKPASAGGVPPLDPAMVSP